MNSIKNFYLIFINIFFLKNYINYIYNVNLMNNKFYLINNYKYINSNNFFFINNLIYTKKNFFLYKKNILNLNIKKRTFFKLIKKNISKNNYINKNKFFITIYIDIYNKNNFIYLMKIKIFNKNKIFYIKYKNYKFYCINYIFNILFKFPSEMFIKISSKYDLFRSNPVTNKIIPHNGIDIPLDIGTKIFSIENGIVNFISFNKYSGKYIIIKHNNLFITKYMHLDKIFVNLGQKIYKGFLIGLSGNTGLSTGPHLHFEMWFNNISVNSKYINFINIIF